MTPGGPHVAVIGCGSIGLRHLRNLLGLGAKVMGVDPDPARRAEVAALGIPSFTSLHDADRADAVCICTPAPLHARLIGDALDRGQDVFVEKPLTADLRSAREVESAHQATDRVLAVGYNLRFEPALAALADALRSGRIGRVLHGRIEFGQYLPDWRPGRDYRATVTARSELGGGILLEASHELDVLSWLFGGSVSVLATVRKVSDLDIDVEDSTSALVETADGVIVEVHVDMVRRGYVRTVTCIGTKGTLDWSLTTGAHLTGPDGVIVPVAPPADRNVMYVLEMRDFLDAVRERRPPRVGAAEGVRALALVEAMRRSSAERKAVRP